MITTVRCEFVEKQKNFIIYQKLCNIEWTPENVMFRTRPESRDSKTVKSRALARDFTVLEFSRAPGRVRNVLSCKVFQSASLPQGIHTLGFPAKLLDLEY